jgi:hypothetical protein
MTDPASTVCFLPPKVASALALYQDYDFLVLVLMRRMRLSAWAEYGFVHLKKKSRMIGSIEKPSCLLLLVTTIGNFIVAVYVLRQQRELLLLGVNACCQRG